MRPRKAPAPPALSEAPTRIESEKFIVEHHPDAWAKDSVRISPDGKYLLYGAMTKCARRWLRRDETAVSL